MTLYDEFYSIITTLNQHRIPYAVVGGLALMFYTEPRFTKDIDILVHNKDLPRLVAAIEKIGYAESAQPWTFENTQLTLHRFINIDGSSHSLLDILVCKDSSHENIIKQAQRMKLKNRSVRVAQAQDIIWLKEKRNSDQDKIDIKNLSYDKHRS